MVELGSGVGEVVESTATRVRIELNNPKTFEDSKSHLAVGQYLLIASGNGQYLLAAVLGLKASQTEPTEGTREFRFVIDTQPIGSWSEDRGFRRGSQNLPVPTETAYLAPAPILEAIFKTGSATMTFGVLSVAPDVPVRIDGDRFFSKHVAVVGSTGSGKSCAVTSILHGAMGLNNNKNLNKGAQKNSHVVIFDIHAEYRAAFTLNYSEDFTLNCLDVDNLKLPYWLMNAEELEEMFIESNEINSHNQVSQFRHAVVRNKCRHNPSMNNVAFDSPVYFDIEEVVTYLENMNAEVIGKLEGEGKPKLVDGTLVDNRDTYYFDAIRQFVPSSTANATKASNGPFHGEFDRLILRLRTRLADPRLRFLFYAERSPGVPINTADFADVVRQFVGYIQCANVSIVDLSGIPFEVLSIVVSLISRMIFDFGFHYSKLRHAGGEVSDVPIMVVCEEAHNYIPRAGGAQYRASQKSLERIAKEGRKYGVTLMVVSQRPSEVSETIFSQCSNFISLRLTNIVDQNYIKSLLPDISSGIGDLLPNLAQGEFLAVGDALLLPTVGQFEVPCPEPHSRSVKYLHEWGQSWREVNFESVIDRWRGLSSREPAAASS